MGRFSRNNSADLAQMRDDEAKAAETSRTYAAKVAATGQPVYGIDEAGWKQRAETFQAEADSYQQKLDGRTG